MYTDVGVKPRRNHIYGGVGKGVKMVFVWGMLKDVGVILEDEMEEDVVFKSQNRSKVQSSFTGRL
jgi:hypothetical protein